MLPTSSGCHNVVQVDDEGTGRRKLVSNIAKWKGLLSMRNTEWDVGHVVAETIGMELDLRCNKPQEYRLRNTGRNLLNFCKWLAMFFITQQCTKLYKMERGQTNRCILKPEDLISLIKLQILFAALIINWARK